MCQCILETLGYTLPMLITTAVNRVLKFPRLVCSSLFLVTLFIVYRSWSSSVSPDFFAKISFVAVPMEKGLLPAAPSNMTDKPLQKDIALSKKTMRKLLYIKEQENEEVNPHPFNYLHNPKSVCQDKVFLLVFIHSAPANLKRRMMIRQTWGGYRHYNTIVRVVFVLGSSKTRRFNNDAISYEYDMYGDIIQEDFTDTYRNLTYKAVAGLKWVSTYCKVAKWILKTDDDMFVNMFGLLRQLHHYEESDTALIICNLRMHSPVLKSSKWKVTEQEYNRTTYPVHCVGTAYILSKTVVPLLHRLSYYVPFFWIDDVYITGMLPEKAVNITMKQISSTYVPSEYLRKGFNSPHDHARFSNVHDFNLIMHAWRRLVKSEKSANYHVNNPF